MAGIVPRPSGGGNIVDHNNTDLVDTLGGYRFNFCPLCGARLEVKSETAHRQFKEDEMKTIKLRYADQAREYFPNILGRIAAAKLAENGEYKCLIDGIKTRIIVDLEDLNREAIQ
jgi:hypothetical protein